MSREEWGQMSREQREERTGPEVREQTEKEERLGQKKAGPLRSAKHTNSEGWKKDGKRSEWRGKWGKGWEIDKLVADRGEREGQRAG